MSWKTGPAPFSGRLHYECLRSWEHRHELRNALEHLFRDGDSTFAVMVDGASRQVEQHGFHYPTEVFKSESCQVLQSDRDNSWVVLERSGSAYFVSSDMLAEIGRGAVPRNGDGVEKSRLNRVPTGPIESWPWHRLTEYLGIADRYPGTYGNETEYEFYGFHPPTTVLEYFVGTPLPLPPDAVTFLSEYATKYVPLDWDVPLDRDQGGGSAKPR